MTPAPPPLPFNPSPLSAVSSLAYAVGVLFLVCVGAYVTVKFLYGRGIGTPLGMGKRLIRVLDRFPLAPQRYLLIVEVGGKPYLLGVTEQTISFLTLLDSEALAKDIAWLDQNEGALTPFNAYLNALSRRWRKNKKEPPDA